MNKSESHPVRTNLLPGWLMVSQLRGGQEVLDGEGLYRRACRLVQEVKAALSGGRFTATSAVTI